MSDLDYIIAEAQCHLNSVVASPSCTTRGIAYAMIINGACHMTGLTKDEAYYFIRGVIAGAMAMKAEQKKT